MKCLHTSSWNSPSGTYPFCRFQPTMAEQGLKDALDSALHQKELTMKPMVFDRIALTAFIAVLAMPAQVIGQAQQSNPPGSAYYRVTDLGALPGGTFSQATGITNR